MTANKYEIELVEGNNVTPVQEEFINHWSQHFFGNVAINRGLAMAPVHWRLISHNREELLSHVAVTEMNIEIDGRAR